MLKMAMQHKYLTPRFGVPVVLLLSFLLAPWVWGAEEWEGELQFAGLSLDRALRLLADSSSGELQLVFTSQWVRPDMRVEAEPVAESAREILDQLLAPHGLVARPGPGGRLVIVPRDDHRDGVEVRGRVRSRDDHRPLAGAMIGLEPGGHSVRTVTDGSFRFSGLAPGDYSVQASHLGFVPKRRRLRLRQGVVSEPTLRLEALPITADEIEVTFPRPGHLGDALSSLTLNREEMLALPSYGEDSLRALERLPGTSGGNASANFQVRGGRADEVMVRLDGLEIVEAFHLKDFSDALSIVAPGIVGGVELLTGGFSVRYGDRMSGVLDLTTAEPEADLAIELGLGLLQARAIGSGSLLQGRGRWLASLRTGLIDLPLRLAGQEENPHFWDIFAKVDLDLRSGQSLRVNILHSGDWLNFSADREGDREEFGTQYRNSYGWLSHQWIPRQDLVVETRGSLSRIDRDRGGQDTQGTFEVRDLRELTALGLAQDWSYQATERQTLDWGVELRRLDIDFDYSNRRALSGPLQAIRHLPSTGATLFDQRFTGTQLGFYASHRLRLSADWDFELGLRFDENSVTDDHLLSPRLHLTRRLGQKSQLRLAWGHFYQSQRVYELQVEDGETDFSRSERAEHRILGFEHIFGVVGARRPWTLRSELYQRRVRDPRVRYENLFEPISILAELQNDRVRFAPSASRAEGLELSLGGGWGRRLDAFFSYTLAESVDQIDGTEVPRSNDQRHALAADLTYRSPSGWDFNLGWQIRSGWPTTALSGRSVLAADGRVRVEPILGPLNGQNLPTYQRLDVRLNRRWRLGRGELAAFVEVRNVYSQSNIRGFDIDLEATPDGGVSVTREAKIWPGVLPNFGFTWSF